MKNVILQASPYVRFLDLIESFKSMSHFNLVEHTLYLGLVKVQTFGVQRKEKRRKARKSRAMRNLGD